MESEYKELLEELMKIIRQIKNIHSVRMLYGFAKTLRKNEKK